MYASGVMVYDYVNGKFQMTYTYKALEARRQDGECARLRAVRFGGFAKVFRGIRRIKFQWQESLEQTLQGLGLTPTQFSILIKENWSRL